MTLLRAYYLTDTGEQLSCYIAPNGTVKLKLASKGYDFIVGIGKEKEETIITDQDEHLVTNFSETASHFCDAVYHCHTEGTPAFDTVLAIAKGKKLTKKLADFTEGWVLPC